MEVKKAKIGNALTSAASDHVVAVSEDIYDESKGRYQSDINEDVLNRLSVLQNRKIVKVVSSLDEVTDEYKNMLILVPQSGGVSGNYFIEYIWNNTRNEFEQIGSIQPSVDLSGYYDKNEVDQKFSNVETSQNELTTALADGSFLVGKASNANTAASVGEKGVNKASLDTEVLQMVTVVDNLTTANTISPLSANQGKVLKEAIDSVREMAGGASVSYDEENETIIVDNSGSGSTNPLRPLFLAEGALYNDTDDIIKRTAPWGTEEKWKLEDDGTYTYWEENALVDHLPKHYYLNGIGNITESEMLDIYKHRDAILRFQYPRCCQYTSIRTFFGMWHQHGISTLPVMSYSTFYFNSKLESAMWYSGSLEGGYDNIVDVARVVTPSNLIYTFNGCTNLKYINPMDLKNTTKDITTVFGGCTSLKEIRLYNLKSNLLLSSSDKISKRSILHAIKNSSPTTAITITLHPDAYARIINQEDIQTALKEKNGYTDESGNEVPGTLPAGASIKLESE